MRLSQLLEAIVAVPRASQAAPMVAWIMCGAGPLHLEPGLWIAGSVSARMPQPRLQEDPGQTH